MKGISKIKKLNRKRKQPTEEKKEALRHAHDPLFSETPPIEKDIVRQIMSGWDYPSEPLNPNDKPLNREDFQALAISVYKYVKPADVFKTLREMKEELFDTPLPTDKAQQQKRLAQQKQFLVNARVLIYELIKVDDAQKKYAILNEILTSATPDDVKKKHEAKKTEIESRVQADMQKLDALINGLITKDTPDDVKRKYEALKNEVKKSIEQRDFKALDKHLQEFITSDTPEDVKQKFEAGQAEIRSMLQKDIAELDPLVSKLDIVEHFQHIILPPKQGNTEEIEQGLERIQFEAKQASQYVVYSSKEVVEIERQLESATKSASFDLDEYIKTTLAESTDKIQERAKAVAQDLKNRHMCLFLKVDPSEFANQNFAKAELSPNFAMLAREFDNLSSMIGEDILTAKSEQHQKNIAKFYVHLLDECMNNQNYQAALAIISGFNKSHVSRLTYLFTDDELAKILEKHSNTFALSGNFGAYRQLLSQIEDKQQVIPPTTIAGKDLTFFGDGMPDLIERNGIKYPHLFKVKSEGKRIIAEIPDAYHYLKNVLNNKTPLQTSNVGERIKPQLGEIEYHTRSIEIYSREEKDQKLPPFTKKPKLAGQPLREEVPKEEVQIQPAAQPAGQPVSQPPGQQAAGTAPVSGVSTSPTMPQPTPVKPVLKDMQPDDPLVRMFAHMLVDEKKMSLIQRPDMPITYDPKKVIIGLLVKKERIEILSAIVKAFADLKDDEKVKFLRNLKEPLEVLIKIDKGANPEFRNQIKAVMDGLKIDNEAYRALEKSVSDAFTTKEAKQEKKTEEKSNKAAEMDWDKYIKQQLASKAPKDDQAKAMADELTALVTQQFGAIKSTDFFNFEKNAALLKIPQIFDSINGMVRDDILLHSTSKKHQHNIMEFYVKVLENLLDSNNLLAAYAVSAVFDASYLANLWAKKDAFQELDPHSKEVLQRATNLFALTNNQRNYRDYIQTLKDKPFIPLLGITTKEITFGLDGNLSMAELSDGDVVVNPTRYHFLGGSMETALALRDKMDQKQASTQLSARVSADHISEDFAYAIYQEIKNKTPSNYSDLKNVRGLVVMESEFQRKLKETWAKFNDPQVEPATLLAEVKRIYEESKDKLSVDEVLKEKQKNPSSDLFVDALILPFKPLEILTRTKIPTQGLNKETVKWQSLVENKKSYMENKEKFERFIQALDKNVPYYELLNKHFTTVQDQYVQLLAAVERYEKYQERVTAFKQDVSTNVMDRQGLEAYIREYAKNHIGDQQTQYYEVAMQALEPYELKRIDPNLTQEAYGKMAELGFAVEYFKAELNESSNKAQTNDTDKVTEIKRFVQDFARRNKGPEYLEAVFIAYPTAADFVKAVGVTDPDAIGELEKYYGTKDASPLLDDFKSGKEFTRKRSVKDQMQAGVQTQTKQTMLPDRPVPTASPQTTPIGSRKVKGFFEKELSANISYYMEIDPAERESYRNNIQTSFNELLGYHKNGEDKVKALAGKELERMAEFVKYFADKHAKADPDGEVTKFLQNLYETARNKEQVKQTLPPDKPVPTPPSQKAAQVVTQPDEKPTEQPKSAALPPKTASGGLADLREFKIKKLKKMADKKSVSISIAGTPADIDVYERKKSAPSREQKLQKTASVQIDYQAYLDSPDYKLNDKAKKYFQVQRKEGKDDFTIIQEMVSKLLTSQIDDQIYREMYEPLGKYVIRTGDVHITHNGANLFIPEQQQQTVSLISIPGIDLQYVKEVLVDGKSTPNELAIRLFCKKMKDGSVGFDPDHLETFQNQYIQIFDRIISTALAQGKTDIVLPTIGCGAFLSGLKESEQTTARQLIAIALDQVVQKYEKEINHIHICSLDKYIKPGEIPKQAQQFRDFVKSKKVSIVNKDIVEVARELSEKGQSVCLVNAADARMRIGMYYATPGGHAGVEEYIALKTDAAECQDAELNPDVLQRITMRQSLPHESKLLDIGKYVARNVLSRSVGDKVVVKDKAGQSDYTIQELFAGEYVIETNKQQRMMYSTGKFSYPVQSENPLQGLSTMPGSGKPPMLLASIAPDLYRFGDERNLKPEDIDTLIADIPPEHHQDARQALGEIKFKTGDDLSIIDHSLAGKPYKVSPEKIDAIRNKYAPLVGETYTALVAQQVNNGQPYAVISLTGEGLSEIRGYGLNGDSQPKEASKHKVSEHKKIIKSTETPTVALYEGHNKNIAGQLVVQSDRTLQGEGMKLALYGGDMEMLARFYKEQVVDGKRPLLVNCNDGVDRTGIVLLGMMMLHEFSNGKDISKLSEQEQKEHIINIVSRLRSQEGRGPSFLFQTHDVARGVILGYGLIAAEKQLAFQQAVQAKIENTELKDIINERNQDPKDARDKILAILDKLSDQDKEIANEFLEIVNERIDIDAQFIIASSEKSEFTKSIKQREVGAKPIVEMNANALRELESQGFDITPHVKKIMPEIIGKFQKNPTLENLELVRAILYRDDKPRFDFNTLTIKAEDKAIIMAARLLEARSEKSGLRSKAKQFIKKATKYTGTGPGMSELKAQTAKLNVSEAQEIRVALDSIQTQDPKLSRLFGYIKDALPVKDDLRSQVAAERAKKAAEDKAKGLDTNKPMIDAIQKQFDDPDNLEKFMAYYDKKDRNAALAIIQEMRDKVIKAVPPSETNTYMLMSMHGILQGAKAPHLSGAYNEFLRHCLSRAIEDIAETHQIKYKEGLDKLQLAQLELNMPPTHWVNKTKSIGTSQPSSTTPPLSKPPTRVPPIPTVTVEPIQNKLDNLTFASGSGGPKMAWMPMPSKEKPQFFMTVNGFKDEETAQRMLKDPTYGKALENMKAKAVQRTEGGTVRWHIEMEAGNAHAYLMQPLDAPLTMSPKEHEILSRLNPSGKNEWIFTKDKKVLSPITTEADAQKLLEEYQKQGIIGELKEAMAGRYVVEYSIEDAAHIADLMAFQSASVAPIQSSAQTSTTSSTHLPPTVKRPLPTPPQQLTPQERAVLSTLKSRLEVINEEKWIVSANMSEEDAQKLSQKYKAIGIEIELGTDATISGPNSSFILMPYEHAIYAASINTIEEKLGMSGWEIAVDSRGNPSGEVMSPEISDEDEANRIASKLGTAYNIATDGTSFVIMVPTSEIMNVMLSALPQVQRPKLSQIPKPIVSEATFLANPTKQNLDGVVNPQNLLVKCLVMIKDINVKNMSELVNHDQFKAMKALLNDLNPQQRDAFMKEYHDLSKKVPTGDINRLLSHVSDAIPPVQSVKQARSNTEYGVMPSLQPGLVPTHPVPPPKPGKDSAIYQTITIPPQGQEAKKTEQTTRPRSVTPGKESIPPAPSAEGLKQDILRNLHLKPFPKDNITTMAGSDFQKLYNKDMLMIGMAGVMDCIINKINSNASGKPLNSEAQLKEFLERLMVVYPETIGQDKPTNVDFYKKYVIPAVEKQFASYTDSSKVQSVIEGARSAINMEKQAKKNINPSN